MKRKKLLSMFLTAAVALTILAPTTAMAEETTTWDAPTSAMTVDNNIAKVGIHAAASTTAFFLGGNVVAERASDYSSITGAATAEDKYQAAMAFTRLGAFGSSSNISPDPYLWNYFYNIALEAGHATGEASADAVYISAGAGSPMSSDTAIIESLGTSYTLDRRPEILMDKAGGYDALIAELPENTDDDPDNNYTPISMSYAANNFSDLSNDMYNLSDAMTASGKSGRYGDTDAIAQNYEAYMKGLQYYVIKQIDNGTIDKKNVAVITDAVDTDDDGSDDSYICVSNEIVIGTSTDRPSESIMYTSNNIIDVLDGELGTAEITTVGRNGQSTTTTETVATAGQVASMDAIILGGHNTKKAAALTAELVAAGVAEEDVPPIYDTDPSDVFTIRANSVENFVGVGIFNGWLYPEILNPVDATMYVYENFWHLKESELQTFAQANFADATVPTGITTDGSTYDESEIEAKIEEGLHYGASVADVYEGTTLELSDRLTNYDLTPEPSLNPSSVTGLAVTGHAATAVRLGWEQADGAQGYIIEENVDGKWQRIKKITNAETLSYRIAGLEAGTTYDFRIKSYAMDGSKALYSEYTEISGKTNPTAVEDLVISGRAGTALRLNWTKNDSATGYIVEQNKDGKWTRLSKITKAETTSYRIANLTAGTTYQFRVRAYSFDGSTAIYSPYTNIEATTNPPVVSDLAVIGKAKTALRLGWTTVDSAQGYIIDKYDNGSWVRVKKITKNETDNYRISGLESGTTYKFRIRAYSFDGDTPIYSGYATIEGTTN